MYNNYSSRPIFKTYVVCTVWVHGVYESVDNIIGIFSLALSCRLKVLTRLIKQFRDPAEALTSLEYARKSHSLPPVLHYRDASTQANFCTDDIKSQMRTLLSMLPESQQPCDLIQLLAPSSIPHKFIAQSLVSMQRLQQAGRSNILAGLAKALGTMLPNDQDSLMPISQMPVGLIEYAVNFFTSKKVCRF